jgi:hypothetical protein
MNYVPSLGTMRGGRKGNKMCGREGFKDIFVIFFVILKFQLNSFFWICYFCMVKLTSIVFCIVNLFLSLTIFILKFN